MDEHERELMRRAERDRAELKRCIAADVKARADAGAPPYVPPVRQVTPPSPPARFDDEAGEAWQVVLDVAAARRLRSANILNVGTLADKDAFAAFYQRLAVDPVFLSDVLYTVCAQQVEERGLTAEDFDRRLAGETIEGAATALLQSVVNFINPKARPTIRRILERTEEVEARISEQNLQALDAIDLAALYGEPSGGSPASSASTPAPSPSAS